MRLRKLLPLAMLGIVGSIGFSAYAFTATNTVPNSKAGEGTSTVSGYTITNIDYTLNGTDPSSIDADDFDLSASPPVGSDVIIKLNTQKYTCTFLAAAVSCDTTSPQATVTPTTSLTVIAAD